MNLFEVIVSIFLISLILLNQDALLAFSMKHTQQSYFYAIAVNQLNNIKERLQVHDDIENQLAIWNQENHQLLPKGIGRLHDGYLTIYWGEKCQIKTKWD